MNSVTSGNKSQVIQCAHGSGVTVFLSDASTHLDVISVTIKREKALPLPDQLAADHAIKILRSLYPVFDWQMVEA